MKQRPLFLWILRVGVGVVRWFHYLISCPVASGNDLTLLMYMCTYLATKVLVIWCHLERQSHVLRKEFFRGYLGVFTSISAGKPRCSRATTRAGENACNNSPHGHQFPQAPPPKGRKTSTPKSCNPLINIRSPDAHVLAHLARVHTHRGAPGRLQEPAALH